MVGPVLLGLVMSLSAGFPGLSVRLADTLRVEISLSADGRLAPRRILLYRSTTRFEPDPDTLGLPVTVREFLRAGPGGSRLAILDTMVAHNVCYYYRARVELPDGRVSWTGIDSVEIPNAELGTITGSSLFIDKLNYFLEVRCGGLVRKRYPVALGSRPRERKLYRDNATTPEGIYRIIAAQPQDRYYRAFDIDYPNSTDRTRYRFLRDKGVIPETGAGLPGIGGGIQVHGEGIARNWTRGGVALRNEDIDELFAHPRVGRGMPVYIVGTGLNRADIQSIKDYRPRAEIRAYQRLLAGLGFYDGKPDGVVGRGMRAALAGFQDKRGLPVTAQLDRRTVTELKRTAESK